MYRANFPVQQKKAPVRKGRKHRGTTQIQAYVNKLLNSHNGTDPANLLPSRIKSIYSSDILKATLVPNFVIYLDPECALSRWHMLSVGKIYPTIFTFNVFTISKYHR